MLAMGRAQTIAQLRAAQQKYQGNPFTNTIAVDAGGTVYSPTRRGPTSPTRRRDVASTAPGKFLYPETFVLDGSRSAASGQHRGAIQRDIFAPRRVRG